jgi:hypothetical protein
VLISPSGQSKKAMGGKNVASFERLVSCKKLRRRHDRETLQLQLQEHVM